MGMSTDLPLNNMTIRTLREQAYLQFLQKWRREVVLLRQQRMGNYGPVLGDPTCRFNAHSPYLRCAVDPLGPCEGCSSYERVEVEGRAVRSP